jgi:MoxR-like ATPase
MARYHDQTAIYEVAHVFAEECLIADGSYFWPGEPVWTEENLDTIWREFAEKPDEGGESFVVKWTNQLSELPVNVFRLAYEVTALYCLYPSARQFGSNAKKKLLDDVLQMGPDLGQRNQSRVDEYQLAIAGNGIGMTGAGYLTNRPFHIGLYLAFARIIKRSGETSLKNINPKETLGQALEMVGDTMRHQPLASMNIILHIFWPDEYEGTSSADYKQRIAKNLSDHFGLTPLKDVDKTILQARKHMENEKGFSKDFNMYTDDVRQLWDKAKTQKISPKFALAAHFRERVLEHNRSFLWPEDENVWTPENARRAMEAIKHLVGVNQTPFEQEMATILDEAERPIYQILCDVRAANILRQPIGQGPARTLMIRHLDVGQPFDGDETVLADLLASSNEEFPGAIRLSGGVPISSQTIVILEGLNAIVSHPDTVGDLDAMVDQFVSAGSYDHDLIPYFPFWTLFYLMFPEIVAPIPAWSPRQKVLKAFSHLTEEKSYRNQMSQVSDIRRLLDPEFDPYTFDFYVQPWVSQWRALSGPDEDELGEPGKGGPITETGASLPVVPSIADLINSTHLDESFLEEIEALLHDKKQLIFEGPPGSGKTFVAEKFARYITGQPLVGDRNEQIELIQFHQSYSYEDFMEGIRPTTNDAGQLVYQERDGIFLRFAKRAEANKDKKFVLIIDEINRGNVSRILGELMLLLEYREQTATLPYSKQELRIPDNLYIIGTMNSADRSLSQIDYALRRRFYFVPFMSVENGQATVLDRWLRVHAPQSIAAVPLFVALNHQLRQHMGTDDLQVGHSYFMRTDIHTDTVQQQVWKYAVMPLLREYLYHHRDRDTLLQQYALAVLNPSKEPVDQDEAATETRPEDVG